MKFVLNSLSSFVICLTLAGQGAPKVQEPEYANKYFLIQADGSLKPLEQIQSTTGNKVTKSQSFPVVRVSTKAFAEMKGDKSPVRLTSSTNFQFVVKATSREYDPADYYHLHRAYVEDGQRRIDINYFKAGGKNMVQEDALKKSIVPTTYEKYGEKSFKMTAKEALSPGEYCLSTNGDASASCFGVD